ncbi:MAG: PilW family protein [Desulfuromonadales bacterium]|nr:PilW family protein [Desulfuromonadales bacterium]
MTAGNCRGVTLLELLSVLLIAGLVGVIVLPACLAFQAQGIRTIGRNDLHDRAERLLRFLANDIRSAAFLTGPQPLQADGSPLALVHDSLPGDPLEEFPSALVPESGGADDDDALTLVTALSFAPPLTLWLAAEADSDELTLNRAPNQPPGSSRELRPAPEAINHLLLANQPDCYPVAGGGQTLYLEQPLAVAAPAGTEVLGVRAFRYLLEPHAGSGRLRRDDFTSREIVDPAVDALQFQYLLADGRLVDQVADTLAIRGVRISLLVRALRPDREHLDRSSYAIADRSYGPYDDHYRRLLVSKLVEVRNHGR